MDLTSKNLQQRNSQKGNTSDNIASQKDGGSFVGFSALQFGANLNTSHDSEEQPSNLMLSNTQPSLNQSQGSLENHNKDVLGDTRHPGPINDDDAFHIAYREKGSVINNVHGMNIPETRFVKNTGPVPIVRAKERKFHNQIVGISKLQKRNEEVADGFHGNTYTQDDEENTSTDDMDTKETDDLSDDSNDLIDHTNNLSDDNDNEEFATTNVEPKSSWSPTGLQLNLKRFTQELLQQSHNVLVGKKMNLMKDRSRRDTKIKCPHCRYILYSATRLKKHMKLVHDVHHGGIYQCNECPKSFPFNSGLIRHAKIMHSDVKPYKCNECGKNFALTTLLKRHYASAHTEPQPVECNECHKMFKNKVTLKRHQLLHVEQRLLYTCSACDKIFTTRDGLAKHWKGVHSTYAEQSAIVTYSEPVNQTVNNVMPIRRLPSKEKKCQICDKIFKTAETLRRHRVIHMEKRPIFKCQECGKEYASRDGLAKHKLLHLNMLFMCELCGKGFKREDYLRDHRERHNNKLMDKTHVCDICGKLFRTPKDVARHKATHTLPPDGLVCVECGKTFKYKRSLKYHMNFHKVEGNSDAAEECSVCGKMFDKKSLERHMLMHNDHHQCYSCSETFANKKSLHDHEKYVHGVDKSHQCEKCGKVYGERGVLSKHLKTVPETPSLPCENCEKALKTTYSLGRPQKVHTEVVPTDCEHCGQEFNNRQGLIHHLRTHRISIDALNDHRETESFKETIDN